MNINSNMERLADAIESMTEANKALRDVIERSADEVGQLEKFVDHLRCTKERFTLFKQTVVKNNHRADELLLRLEQELVEKRELAKNVRRQIDVHKDERKAQDAENQRLERMLDENVDLLKTNLANSNLSNAYMNSTMPTRGKMIDRLLEDMAH